MASCCGIAASKVGSRLLVADFEGSVRLYADSRLIAGFLVNSAGIVVLIRRRGEAEAGQCFVFLCSGVISVWVSKLVEVDGFGD